ncbi:acyl-CoA dehydrogenase [Bacillus ectoiniformans]|uniref:acyl-CoA dehydrogenase n=1 Tax=Bacillus ectoiniformans TaxID=1494429 RepID=UPI00195DDB4C|nr:acyl-CoA dehydrogenase [Bacillus ectoiniformans]
MRDQDVTAFIREASAWIEVSGSLPDEILDYIYKTKLFKLFVPKSLNGLEMSLPDGLYECQKASSMDGSFGWLVTIGSGGGMFVPYFHSQTADELFSPSEAVIAGSGSPSGVAEPIAGGFLVSGEWKYCSGANHATMVTANCLIKGKTDDMLAMIFLPEEVEIKEDWQAFGLKGTGSHTVMVKDIFVPTERTFSIFKRENAFGYEVHSFPFQQFSEASFTAVCLGIGEHFLEEAETIYKEKRAKNPTVTLISDPLKKAMENHHLLEGQFYLMVKQMWEKHTSGSALSEDDLAKMTGTCLHTVQAVIDSANQLLRHLGMEAIMETSTINRIWRDLLTCGQHEFLKPSS